MRRVWRRPETPPEFAGAQVVATPDGLCVRSVKRELWSLRWADVTGVLAFKRDRFSVDLVCFGFVLRDQPARAWCLHEEMRGYKAILPEIDRVTQGAWTRDSASVVFPPFEFCWTVLWQAPGAQPIPEEVSLVWDSAEA